MPHPTRTGGPIMPPLAAPQPSWKQELKPGEGDKGKPGNE
jgi:hypothetical protein